MTVTNSNFGGGKGSFCLTDYRLPWKEAKTRTQGRDLDVGTEAGTSEELI